MGLTFHRMTRHIALAMSIRIEFMKKIVAIGGGSMAELETLDIDKRVIELSGKANPRALFIPTASYDNPERYDLLHKLDVFKQAGKLVLTVDYAGSRNNIDDAYRKSSAKGYVPYVSTRDLDRLFIYDGHEPD